MKKRLAMGILSASAVVSLLLGAAAGTSAGVGASGARVPTCLRLGHGRVHVQVGYCR
ncbi:MAG TPA: hypothetical protein VF972_12495 [Actinomycetota bacterium]